MNNDYDSLTYRQVTTYHETIRQRIFKRIEEKYISLKINVGEITYKDAMQANSWKALWHPPVKAATWDWVDLYYQYHTRGGARRFDMAISKSGRLISLCYGMMERNRFVLKLHALEHSPLPYNTIAGQTLNINLFAAELYADLNGTAEIWICDPVSPAHVRLYSSKGYTPYEDSRGNITHLVTRL